MDESLPCPVCGGRAWAHYEPTTIRIYCPCCDILGPKKDTIDEARAAWNALPRALEWTDEPPKVPGLYWTRKMKGDPPIIFTIYERNTPKGRVRIEARIFFSSVTSRTYRGEKPEHLGLEWAGPIHEPREPK